VKRAVALVVAAVAVTFPLAACGGGGSSTAVPTKVSTSLIPSSLSSGKLALAEDKSAHKRFASAGSDSLVSDGRLWAVRDGNRLVATLQVSTLAPKVDLADKKSKASLVASILPGTRESFEVGDVRVVSVSTEDKVVYLWFGASMFEVLQVKGNGIDPEKVLGELLAFQLASPAWHAAPAIED